MDNVQLKLKDLLLFPQDNIPIIHSLLVLTINVFSGQKIPPENKLMSLSGQAMLGFIFKLKLIKLL